MSAKPVEHKSDSLKTALGKSVAVHIVISIILFGSFNFASPQIPLDVPVNAAPTIQARAVSSERVEQLVTAKQQKIEAAKREERRQEQLRQKRIADQKQRERERQDEIKRKKAAADAKKKAEEDAKRKAEADAKRKREEEAKRKAEADAKRKAQEEAKRKADAEAKAKAEAEAKAKAEAEARERAESAAREKRVLSELEKYQRLIMDKVSRNWIVNNQRGQCILLVRVTQTGFVIDVREESGDPTICRSAKAAVYKSDPLPVSKDPAVFQRMRTLRLILDPEKI